MALVNAYATVAQFRTHMGDTNSQLNLEKVERALNATSRAIDRFCGRRFWIDTNPTVRTYKGEDPYTAWVYDIATTQGLTIKTDTTGGYTWSTTWATSDYDLEPADADKEGDASAYAWWRICAIDRYTFPVSTQRKTLQVTAKHGWSAIPVDVEEACLIKASGLFERSKSPLGMQSGISEFGVVRISRSDPDVVGLLMPYAKLDVRAI